MKYFLCFIVGFLSLSIKAQDTIYTINGDTIACIVKMVTPTHINYMQTSGDSRMIARKLVNRYIATGDITIMDEDIYYEPVRSPNPDDITADFSKDYVEYQKVIELPGMASDKIYKDIKLWVVNTYVSPDRVISADIPNETIVGNGFCENCISTGGLVYRFQLEIKEAKLRITFNNFETTGLGGRSGINVENRKGAIRTDRAFTNLISEMDREINNLINSLESFILNSKNRDDW